jgi:hypothetical protein
MRARTPVSEAIEPLRDVRDYNVATHHHSVYRTTFSRGLGYEDLFAVYRVLKPSGDEAPSCRICPIIAVNCYQTAIRPRGVRLELSRFSR